MEVEGPLKVALVVEQPEVFDISASAAGLARRGHEVVVYTRPDDRRTPDGGTAFRVVRGPDRTDDDNHLGGFADFVTGRLRVLRPDVVHAHHWTSGLAALAAVNGTAVPVVHSFHSLGTVTRRLGRWDASPPERVDAERLIGRRAAHVIAASQAELRELLAMGVARTKVTVVPHAVDTRRFRPRGTVSARRLARRVVAVGSLVPHEGLGDVVTALSALPDTELVIAGRTDADPRRWLRDHAKACGVLHRVRFAGPVSQAALPTLLRSADVVVCAPWDSLDYTVALEAMACGTAVVATEVGGLAEAVVDGVAGLLVPPREPRALARALRTLLADDARRFAHGVAGVDRVESCYSPEQEIGEVERVHHLVTGRTPPDRPVVPRPASPPAVRLMRKLSALPAQK
ncbi:glycosyltransferase [Actinosynnema sp. NPDC023587]|uniref:glycosyltransferase n=1 Tax=Actinosynnema sp. NPDC023587 TaxID=3154695 RepID=UPI0033DB2C1A